MPAPINPKKNQEWRESISKSVTKLTPEVVKKLKEAFAIGATVKQACQYAEISERSYYNWTEKNPILLHEFERMRQILPLAAKANIAAGVQTLKDIGLSRWLLEKNEPDLYGETLTLKHQGDIGSAVHVDDVEAVKTFHKTLLDNLKKRTMEKAKEDGELPQNKTS